MKLSFRLFNLAKRIIGVTQVLTDVAQKLGLKTFDVYERGHDLILNMLIVPKESRKQGLGSKAMDILCDYADNHNKRVVLSPGIKDRSIGTTSRSRLIEFYKRWDFVENKGRNKDFTIREGMYRLPKKKN